MKKNDRVAHELEDVVAGVTAVREWAAPRVDAAYGWAKPRLEKGLETAGPALQDTYRRAADGISGGISTVTPKIQDGIDKVGPRLSQLIDDTTPRLQGTLDKAGPAITTAKGKVVDEYLPALSTRLGEAADTASRSLAGATVPPAVEKTVTKVTGNKKSVKNAQKRLAAAAKQTSKDLKKNQARKSGKGWLVLGIVMAALVAGVAAWRASKPVEDPWKTPAPIKATPAPVSSAKSEEAKEVIATIKEAADRAAAAEGQTEDTKTQADVPAPVTATKNAPETTKNTGTDEHRA
ncbi:hypothetical protein [uncultured Arthrobacter sp.]|uniref:hypothetical protein n=1 Tax=uncultured Arthrobacter sp. TaxID=114050 RepID=UPI0026103B58|nr:hypothetical protein [uncultured Arthrobacter sp.]